MDQETSTRMSGAPSLEHSDREDCRRRGMSNRTHHGSASRRGRRLRACVALAAGTLVAAGGAGCAVAPTESEMVGSAGPSPAQQNPYGGNNGRVVFWTDAREGGRVTVHVDDTTVGTLDQYFISGAPTCAPGLGVVALDLPAGMHRINATTQSGGALDSTVTVVAGACSSVPLRVAGVGTSTGRTISDITSVRLAGSNVSARYVDAPIPTGTGAAPTVQGPTTATTVGGTMQVAVTATPVIDRLLVTVEGSRGYYEVPIPRPATSAASAGGGTAARDAVEVRYNLEIKLSPNARDNLTVGISSAIGTILSLMSGIQICIPGPCVAPPPPPNVNGSWQWQLTANVPGGTNLPAIPVTISGFTPHADATATFLITFPDRTVATGQIASNRGVTITYYNCSSPITAYGGAGIHAAGRYVASSSVNAGRPEITSTGVGAVACTGPVPSFLELSDGLRLTLRKQS